MLGLDQLSVNLQHIVPELVVHQLAVPQRFAQQLRVHHLVVSQPVDVGIVSESAAQQERECSGVGLCGFRCIVSRYP